MASDPTIQARNSEIAELLRRLDEGWLTPTECAMGIEDAIRAAHLKATRAGYRDRESRDPHGPKTTAPGTKRRARSSRKPKQAP